MGEASRIMLWPSSGSSSASASMSGLRSSNVELRDPVGILFNPLAHAGQVAGPRHPLRRTAILMVG